MWYAVLNSENFRPLAVEMTITRSERLTSPARDDLLERRQRHGGVRAVEHARAIRTRGGLGQLALARLFDDAVELLERANGLVDRDRVADLDGRRERRPRLHRLERPVRQIRGVERVGGLRLRDDDPRALGDEPELEHHLEARGDRADVPEVAAGQDHDVGHLPIELLNDLERQRLLAFEPEAVHRVGEIHALFGGEPLHDGHAAVEVGVEREDERAVGERLHELGG